MGLFKKKNRAKKPTPNKSDEITELIFDTHYRDELRELGRRQLRGVISAAAANLEQDIDISVSQITAELKEYMKKQLDITVARVNTEITEQLNERISDYSRVSGEAQELVVQSLSRNAQMVYEKYQQMSANLQKIVASQEVMMVTVFQDNRSQIAATQAVQEKAIKSLSDSANTTQQQAEQLNQALRHNISTQATRLTKIYQENLDQIEQTKRIQAGSIEALSAGARAVDSQHQQLSQLLDESIAKQKAMAVELINDNMAQIIEHYLIGALGEQSDLRSQLPTILQRMEESKQLMVDDMKL